MYPQAVAERLRDPALHCSSVLVLLVDNFGTEILGWEPESIRLELKDVFKLDENRLLSDKINGAMALVSSDLYHKSLEAFTSINAALNLRTVSSREFNWNTLDDIMWGVTEARMLEGPDVFKQAGFSHDIGWYTGMMLAGEGITRPPASLAFAEFEPGELDRRDLTLASDPIAAETYWRRQEDERAKLEKLAAETLVGLLKEIESLPLAHGKAVIPEAFSSAK